MSAMMQVGLYCGVLTVGIVALIVSYTLLQRELKKATAKMEYPLLELRLFTVMEMGVSESDLCPFTGKTLERWEEMKREWRKSHVETI